MDADADPRDIEATKEEVIEMEGTVQMVLPDTRYLVTLENGHEVVAFVSGRMEMHRARILAGDTVRLEITPYDLSKARITFRRRDENLAARVASRPTRRTGGDTEHRRQANPAAAGVGLRG